MCVNVDTSASFGSDSVEAKAAGFGFKVGNETGISTSIGEVSVDVGLLYLVSLNSLIWWIDILHFYLLNKGY